MAADLKVALIVTADVRQAQAGLATAVTSVDQVSQSLAAIAPASAAATAPIAQFTGAARAVGAAATDAGQRTRRSFDEIRASVDSSFASAQKYQAVQAEIAAAVASGEVSQSSASIALEYAAKAYMGLATSAERAAAAERDKQAAAVAARQSYELVRASVDSVYAASMRYEAGLAVLDAALAKDQITAAEYARTLALLEAQMIDTNAVDRDRQAATAAARLGYEQLRSSVDSIYATSMRYEAAIETLNAAQRAGVITDKDRERTLALLEAQMIDTSQAAGAMNRSAAQRTMNLGYQANDVFMMASLGQSPFALMMQQGPQVVQVLNEMRASGQALGPAIAGSFRMMFNPMALATMAIIAGGAALVQWGISAISASRDSRSLEDRLNDLEAATARVNDRLSVLNLDNPEQTFGSLTDDVVGLTTALLELDRAAQLRELRSTLDATLSQNIEPGLWQRMAAGVAMGANPQAAPILTGDRLRQENYDTFTGGRGLSFEEFGQRQELIDTLAVAGDVQGVIAEINRLFVDMAEGGPVTTMNAQVQTMLSELGKVALTTARVEAQFNGSADAAAEAARAAAQLAVEEARREADAERRADEQAAEQSSAESMLATQERRNELLSMEVLFGRDSAQYRTVQRQQEMDILDAKLAELDVSADLKAQIRAAVQEGFALDDAMRAAAAATGSAAGQAGAMAANIRAALGYAQGLAGTIASLGFSNIGLAAEVGALEAGRTAADASIAGRMAEERARLAPLLTSGDPDARGGAQSQLDALESRLRTEAELSGRRDTLTAALSASGTTATGGGAGASAAAETSAVQDLIQSLQDEIAIARELDPVQQEMLRNREALAAATPEERAEVEELIRTRNAEAEALERTKQRMEDIRDLGRDVVGGFLQDLRAGADDGEILLNFLDRVADKLADLAETSIIDGLFGQQGSTTGVNLASLIAGWLFPGAASSPASAPVRPQARPFASGGVFDSPQYFAMGAGGLGVMAEDGPEAIMPLSHSMGGGVGARLGGEETTLPLIRLASGKLGVDLGGASPFAMGGAFGDIAAASAPASWRQAGGSAAPAQPAVIQLQPTIVNNTGRPMDVAVEEYTDAAGQRQQRYVLSEMTAEGLSVPGGRGGKALQQGYGLRRTPRARG